MDGRKKRTRALAWDPAVLPPAVVAGRGRRAVRAAVIPVGRDLLVTLTGGQAHAGAVALAAPAATDVGSGGLIVLPPHKEGPLASEGGRVLAEAAGCTCVVVAGIHQDGATPLEIAAIVANARLALARLATALAAIPAAQRYCRDRLPKPSTP